MRFLNTTTLAFKSISGSKLQEKGNEYAILSHVWGEEEDEISFEDMGSSRDISDKKGFSKLSGFCKLALSLGCQYAWIDTCCIDKANPTELSEAIRSMYRWYQNAEICIVYLEDVSQTDMMDSKWFSRVSAP